MNWQQLDRFPPDTYVEGKTTAGIWLSFVKLADGDWQEIESGQRWTKYQVAGLEYVDLIK